MMLNLKGIIAAAILCVSAGLCTAQSNISAALTGLGADFGDRENAPIYKIKADDAGKILLEPGLRLGGEIYASDITSLKFAQTIKIDCMQKAAFSTQVMLRFRLFKIYKHSLSIGIGPCGFYRQTWEDEEGYIDEGVYHSGSFQTKICWLSGELEYNYYLSKKNDLSVAIVHGSPEGIALAIGIKHWISRKSSHCNTCPSFHH
ncbi:MAG: hypothetical protein IKQ70_05905 [Bacteroidales bacterium]|nr:hypothetical protein [Bacteroidales bacterium]